MPRKSHGSQARFSKSATVQAEAKGETTWVDLLAGLHGEREGGHPELNWSNERTSSSLGVAICERTKR